MDRWYLRESHIDEYIYIVILVAYMLISYE